MNYRAYAAELVGTFLLAFMIRISIAGGYLAVSTPVTAGLTLGLIVYMFGAISGAHVNPAVTIGLASIGKIKPKEAGFYVIAQVTGGLLAFFAGNAFVGTLTLEVGNTTMIAIAELIGAAVLVLGVSSVVHGKVSDTASGLTIGTALTLGVLGASAGSLAVVNPAVAIGIGSLSAAYILGPIAGGIIAAWGYRALAR